MRLCKINPCWWTWHWMSSVVIYHFLCWKQFTWLLAVDTRLLHLNEQQSVTCYSYNNIQAHPQKHTETAKLERVQLPQPPLHILTDLSGLLLGFSLNDHPHFPHPSFAHLFFFLFSDSFSTSIIIFSATEILAQSPFVVSTQTDITTALQWHDHTQTHNIPRILICVFSQS